MKNIILWVLLGILGLGLSIGGWYLARWWNYKWSYQAYVREEIKKQIVPLSLDLAESRKREDLLLQEIKLIDYQLDVLTKKFLDSVVEEGK